MPLHANTLPHTLTHAHTRPHTPTHAHTRPHRPKPCLKFFYDFIWLCWHFLLRLFRRLFIALLTIFCGGFLDIFFTALFVLLYYLCSTKFVHAVQKSVAFFRGGGGGGRGVCVEVSPSTTCCCQKWSTLHFVHMIMLILNIQKYMFFSVTSLVRFKKRPCQLKMQLGVDPIKLCFPSFPNSCC